MIFNKTPSKNEIINLLSKLKVETPDYPNDLLAARKAAFINQTVATKIDGSKPGGKGGGDGGSGTSAGSSGSGALSGDMSAAQGILLQAVIGVWVIAAMLTTAYVFRNQIIDLLQDNGFVVEITQLPPTESTDPAFIAPASGSPSPGVPPTEVTSPSVTPVPGASSEGASDSESSPDDQDNTKDNPGLHLGQTPGAPDTPNQDKPNKPDKPEKSDKSNKHK
jgi:hypothetical protein